MCLLVAAYDCHADYRLVLIGNRDEFHARPTAPLGWWDDTEGILAGRDLAAGGTWLGLGRDGRLGVVTNYRSAGSLRPEGPSRGTLIPRFLSGAVPSGEYVPAILREAGAYSGFSLMLMDEVGLTYLANHPEPVHRELERGIYGLSNDRLDTPWPKVVRTRERVARILASGAFSPAALFHALSDRRPAPDRELPDTGIGIERERLVSAPFVVDPAYGTRSTTLVLVGRDGLIRVEERRYDQAGETTGRTALAFRATLAAAGHG